MDPLSWALMTWLAIAGFLFYALQKAVEVWPVAAPAGVEPAPYQHSPTKQTFGLQSAEPLRVEITPPQESVPVVERPVRKPSITVGTSTDPPASASAKDTAETKQTGNVLMSMPLPGTGGEDNKWVNDLLEWTFHKYKGVPDFVVAWMKSLNEAAKKVTSPASCEVLFENFNESTSDVPPPKITNIRAEQGPRDHMVGLPYITFIGDIHVSEILLRLVSSQKLPDRLLVSNYNAKISDLRGEAQVRMACIANEMFLMACFNGRPGMRIELSYTDTHSAGGQVNPDLVADAIRKCIISSVTNISLNNTQIRQQQPDLMTQSSMSADNHQQQSISLDLRSSSASPAAHSPTPNTAIFVEEPKQEQSQQQQQISPNAQAAANEVVKRVTQAVTLSGGDFQKLAVKVLRAQKLGGGAEVHQPFVCMELDDPSHRQHTSKGLNFSPYWEEEFTFELSPKSEELLFEIYDGFAEYAQPKFLGLAIVSLEEIRKSNQCLHSLPLQSRPYYEDPASGTLTVEFIFMPSSGLSANQFGKSVTERQEAVQNGVVTETHEIARRPLIIQDGDQNMDLKVTPTNSTTVMVKSVSQYFQEPVYKPEEAAANKDSTAENQLVQETLLKHEENEEEQPPPVPPRLQPTGTKEKDDVQVGAATLERITNDNSSKKPPAACETTSDVAVVGDRRGRPERRSNTFFAQLKERLSFSTRRRSRARSADIGPRTVDGVSQAVSAPAQSRDLSEGRYAASMYGGGSVMSEGSVVSAVSTKSLYARSTLVVEVKNNSVAKYYLIPANMLDNTEARKLMRRGKKLHVFNEHTFIAVRVRGKSMCNVCGQAISRTFGRQAYQCRDCHLVCHKQCHHKTDVFCPQSSVSSLEIVRRRTKLVSFTETNDVLIIPARANTLPNSRVHLGGSMTSLD